MISWFRPAPAPSLLDLAARAHLCPAEWYLVFCAADARYWWTRFLPAGFEHCHALKFDGFNWLKFEPSLVFTAVDILPFGAYDSVLDVVGNREASILRLEVWRDPKRMRLPWVLGPWTCVEQVKALLGWRAPWILTPAALYRRALREGARVMQTRQTIPIAGGHDGQQVQAE